MWAVVGLSLVVLLVTYITHWITQWRNPKCNGVLPPGSMGWPLVGETLNAMTKSYSLDLHPFYKKRLQKYGPIFRTSLAGRPIVVSVDPEFNSYLFQQEGKLVELWYLDSFTKIILVNESKYHSSTSLAGKPIVVSADPKFNSYLFQQEGKLVELWYLDSFTKIILVNESKYHSSTSLAGKPIVVSADPKFNSYLFQQEGKLVELWYLDSFTKIILVNESKYHSSTSLAGKPIVVSADPKFNSYLFQQEGKLVELWYLDSFTKIILVNESKYHSSTSLAGKPIVVSADPKFNSYLFQQEGKLVELRYLDSFTKIFKVADDISAAEIVHKYVTNNEISFVVKAENEALLKNRENANSSLTWDEYKSMTFTRQVINETLRLGNVAPALLRRALKDIPVKGFTIPAGWTIVALTSALQLSPNTFKDPLEFNPWRWKDLDSLVISKNFMPFGRGSRQCAGAEYSRVFLATFLHVMVTKYSWKRIKAGPIARTHVLGFGASIHIKLSEKKN
ncbi:cytochrome P450 87A3-like [Prunus avium]|uniref:Cytochrome P450 87A3-like n=1 Tax=Prunus avium TaxID=42229 RepID=A0A6P5U0F7_PRUAV|nr:cytochrome P450 87A3-like [Prunus avium]